MSFFPFPLHSFQTSRGTLPDQLDIFWRLLSEFDKDSQVFPLRKSSFVRRHARNRTIDSVVRVTSDRQRKSKRSDNERDFELNGKSWQKIE